MKRFISLLIICSLLSVIPTLSMVASAEDGILHETDDNNSSQTANALQVGAMMVGRLTDESDVDYYRMETTSTGDIMFHFDHQSDKVYNYYWYAEVTDENGAVLSSGNLSGKEATDFSVQSVKPGVYYLKITKAMAGNPFMIGFSDAAYNITVSTKCLVHAELTDWEITLEASCNSTGERVQRCSACNEIIVTEKIAELDHSYNDWSIEDEAELFKIGEKKCTCVLCGKVKNKAYLADESKTALKYGGIGLGVIVVALFIIACFAPDVGDTSKYTAPAKPATKSNTGNNPPASSQNNDKASTEHDYPKLEDLLMVPTYDDPTPLGDYDPVFSGPTVTINGEDHPVYTTGIEGEPTGPYRVDVTGASVPVDEGTINEPFNWLDC